jgi:S1-C subfamily serine protease
MDHTPRPFLGVSLQDTADGVTIAEVVDGSAAADAGLQAGDIISAVNGTSVTTVADTASAIGALSVGDQVTLDISRSGDTMTVTATLGEQTKDDRQPMNPFGQGRGGRDQMFGFQYNPDDQSWTITGLSEDSPLYIAGLREGDVIKTVDGSTYNPASLLQYVTTLAPDATVTLGIERDGAAQDITLNASDLMMIGGMGMGNFFGRGSGGNGMPFDFSQMMPMFQSMYGNGFLGVAFQPIDATVAQENNLSVTEGALINEVVAGSPAETAGLQVGDVVTAVNGEAVDEEHTLRDRLIAYEPDDTVTLTVLRDGASQDIQATLGQPQTPDMGQFFNFPFGGRGNRGGQDQPEATPEAMPNA